MNDPSQMTTREALQALIEIRDAQREHLAEYRRVTKEQLELSRRAVQRQEEMTSLYKKALTALALVILGLCLFLAWAAGMFR